MKTVFSADRAKRFLFSFIAAFLPLFLGISCLPGLRNISLSEVETFRNYAFSGFHGVEASGNYDIRLISASKDSICVYADSALFPYMKIEEKNGILTFGFKESLRLDKENTGIHVDVFYAGVELDVLRASGAARIQIEDNLHASSLEIRLTGASELEGMLKVHENLKIFMSGASSLKGDCRVNGQAKIKMSGSTSFIGDCTVTGKMSLELSGAGDIAWTGYAEKADVQLSGASRFRGFDMMTEELFVIASGASDMEITVNRKMKARVSGSSHIRYQGTPSVESTVSGAGSVVPVR